MRTEQQGELNGTGELGDPAMPGVQPQHVDTALVTRLQAALKTKLANGSGYQPRTHHMNDDGAPTYVNRLMLETSPYLLQHAHNPVNWFAWGEEAFARAKAEDKPVFLSIGYSTCHWCHVMERESFEDVEIARYINTYFVPIKVDREERPDIDAIYMRAVQLMTGRGGWPMTTMLTPDGKPFFGGTYFPPRDGVRGARHGLMTILGRMVALYGSDREQLFAQANQLSARMAQMAAPARPGDVPGAEVITRAVAWLDQSYDDDLGGFGRAPKFPQPSRIALLLRYARRTQEASKDTHKEASRRALKMATHTLHAMADGGMYDHIGGGFHRYATDARWLVPHFEKMLYDNAQLATVYVEASQWVSDAKDKARFETVARETLDYVAREMTAPSGGFYSATDADSPTFASPSPDNTSPDNTHTSTHASAHDEEGWFFTWTPAEIRHVLGEDSAKVFEAFYGVTARGNFEGRSILYRTRSLGDGDAGLVEAKRALYEARLKRPAPGRDDKVVAGWNGLMIRAFAQAAMAFNEPRYAVVATKAADFLLAEMVQEERLARTWMDGQAKHAGVLDDYAAVIGALIEVYQASGKLRYLEQAMQLQTTLDAHYTDAQNGGYFLTADDGEALLSRDKPDTDGAVPSGNSLAAMNVLQLHTLTGEDGYRQQAEKLFAALASGMRQHPMSMPRLLAALDAYLDTPMEVVLIQPNTAHTVNAADATNTLDATNAADALADVMGASFVPGSITLQLTEAQAADAAKRIPWLQDKTALQGRTTAYVCERGRCALPTSNASIFRSQLARTQTYDAP